MAIQLRCDGTLFGIVSDDGNTIEVKCKRRHCGAAPGLVVLHTLSMHTGQVLNTQIYKDPREE